MATDCSAVFQYKGHENETADGGYDEKCGEQEKAFQPPVEIGLPPSGGVGGGFGKIVFMLFWQLHPDGGSARRAAATLLAAMGKVLHVVAAAVRACDAVSHRSVVMFCGCKGNGKF